MSGVCKAIDWRDERNVETLKKMIDENAPPAEIAEALGAPGAKNAVIGKAFRLRGDGVIPPLNVKPALTTGGAEPKRGRAGAKAVMARRPAPVVAPPRRVTADEILPESRLLPIVELRGGVCRWPFGDDPRDVEMFRYCGADCRRDADGGWLTYCPPHARLAVAGGAPPGT